MIKRFVAFTLAFTLAIISPLSALAETPGGGSEKQSSQKGNLSFLAHLMMGRNLIFRSGGQGQAMCLWHP